MSYIAAPRPVFSPIPWSGEHGVGSDPCKGGLDRTTGKLPAQ